MRKQEIEVFSDAVNAPVLRQPGRRFPGSLIQGDSLSVLWGLARSIRDRVAGHADEDLVEDAEELFELIHGRLLGYQANAVKLQERQRGTNLLEPDRSQAMSTMRAIASSPC